MLLWLYCLWDVLTHGSIRLLPLRPVSVASALCPAPVQALEAQLKAHLSAPAPNTKSPTTPRFQKCLTMQEVFSQHQGACLGLTYHRIPVPDFCAPREEVRGQASGDQIFLPRLWPGKSSCTP